jgi:hypothetical protein
MLKNLLSKTSLVSALPKFNWKLSKSFQYYTKLDFVFSNSAQNPSTLAQSGFHEKTLNFELAKSFPGKNILFWNSLRSISTWDRRILKMKKHRRKKRRKLLRKKGLLKR